MVGILQFCKVPTIPIAYSLWLYEEEALYPETTENKPASFYKKTSLLLLRFTTGLMRLALPITESNPHCSPVRPPKTNRLPKKLEL